MCYIVVFLEAKYKNDAVRTVKLILIKIFKKVIETLFGFHNCSIPVMDSHAGIFNSCIARVFI
jgi:hypothetical protein